MPIQRCTSGGKRGWRWGRSGRCYVGTGARAKAGRQAAAIHASGYVENARPVRLPSPSRIDPTMLKTPRRAILTMLRVRYRALKARLREWVPRLLSMPDPVGSASGRLGGEVEHSLSPKEAGRGAWWDALIDKVYTAGVSRAYDEVRRSGGLTDAGIVGGRAEFLRRVMEADLPEVELPKVTEPVAGSGLFVPATWLTANEQVGARDVWGRFISERAYVLSQRMGTEIKGLSAGLVQEMAREIADGLQHGKSAKEIGVAIERRVDVSLGRANRIAQTEFTRAHAEGQLDAMKQLGVATVERQAEWVTTSGNACPLCAANAGRRMPIDQARGMIPLHPSCMCAWRAVIVPVQKPEQPTQASPEDAVRSAFDQLAAGSSGGAFGGRVSIADVRDAAERLVGKTLSDEQVGKALKDLHAADHARLVQPASGVGVTGGVTKREWDRGIHTEEGRMPFTHVEYGPLNPRMLAGLSEAELNNVAIMTGRPVADLRARASAAQSVPEPAKASPPEQRQPQPGKPPIVGRTDDGRTVYVNDQDAAFVRRRNIDAAKRVVYVEVSKLDEAWSKDQGYVPPGGGGAEIGGRRAGFKEFMEKGGGSRQRPIEMPVVWIDKDGVVSFVDGRHRFSVLRDLGHGRVPVLIDPSGVARLKGAAGVKGGKR